MPRVDLIADVGENFGNYELYADDELLPILTSANVACGFHAGDPRVMQRTVDRCVALDVAIGAHPGFPDLVGFGRRDMRLNRNEVFTDVLYQVGALDAFVRASGGVLQHVTPHGRLGNLTQVDPVYAAGVVDAVEAFDPELLVVGIGGELERDARERGLRTARLAVVDRAYTDDGRLVPRTEPGALLHDPDEVAARTVRLFTEGVIASQSGLDVPLHADSVLLHGDNPSAIANARTLRARLTAAGVELAPLDDVVGARRAGVPRRGARADVSAAT